MRRAAASTHRTQVARTLSVPAPVGGWNARDPLAEMNPADAVILDNFFCTPYDVRARLGHSVHASGFAGGVNSLMSYAAPSGADKLFAAQGAGLYDVTNAGAIGNPVVGGLSSDKFQKVMFGTSGGNFLVACNGVDLPLIFNGIYWGNLFSTAFAPSVSSLTSSGATATCTMAVPHNLKTGMAVTIAGASPSAYNGTYVITVTGLSSFTYTFAGGTSPATGTITATPAVNFALTGVNPALFVSAMVTKARLWFIESGTLKVWFVGGTAGAVGGAASSLDLGPYCARGGFLQAMAVWTLDAGQGMDDYVVFITSEGEVVVYRGSDPTSTSTWAQVGVYQIGTPIGRRCVIKYQGDVLIICKEGLAPLSKTLMSSRVNTREMLTDKIQHVVSDYTTNYSGNFGWQVLLYPEENMLIMNVPTSGSESLQLVMNTISGAWSRFLGWNARCWEWHNDAIYFGEAGTVSQAWDTYADNGDAVQVEALQAFNYAGRNTSLKHVRMVRPTITTDGSPGIFFGVNADFDQTPPSGIPTYTENSLALWDTAMWDVDTWTGAPSIKKDWQSAFALGYCFGAHMVGTVRVELLRWASTDYVLEQGGVI